MIRGGSSISFKFKIMCDRTPKENCELCDKPIYTHDTILICNFDNKSYHENCLKIDNDTAYKLHLINMTGFDHIA